VGSSRSILELAGRLTHRVLRDLEAVRRLKGVSHMSRVDWTRLLVKVFALFQAISFLIGIPIFFTALSTAARLERDFGTQAPWALTAGLFTSIILVPLAIALILWQRSTWIAERLWSGETNAQPISLGPVTSEQIQITAFSTLGLYILATTIPDFLRSLAGTVEAVTLSPRVLWPDLITLSSTASLIGQVIQIGIALALLIGPGSLAKTVLRLWQPRPAA
jgi:hypothetical protein